MLSDLGSPSQEVVIDVYRLNPRAVVRASAGGHVRMFQASYTSDAMTAKARQVSMETRALLAVLGPDPNSAALCEQGRMPGSRNNKVTLEPPQPATASHESPGALMGE